MNISTLTGLGLLATTLGLAACGGGGSGDNTASPPPPPAGPTAIAAVGTITGFGSVYVNGIRYEVRSDTVVDIEGEAESMGDDSRLRLGMKVHVVGDDNGGQRSADRIKYDDDLRGVVESITLDAGDPSIGSFTVVGLTVTVDADTVFDDDIGNNDGIPGIDLRDLQVGMVVEISGFPTDSGFLATRVDREFDAFGNNPDVGRPDVDDDELEIKGFVEGIAGDNTFITVNGIDFLITPATFFDDGLMLNDDLLGVFVEVKADIAGGDYVAVRIEREDDFDDDNDHDGEFEIEGVLQSVDSSSSPNTFTINGMTIPVNDASALAALVGMRVEIKGSFNANQVLVLREAERDDEDNVRTEDLVSEVDINAVSFTTRLGLSISPTGGSRVEDDAGNDDDGDRLTPEQFVNRLQIGDRIKARGFDNGSPVAWNRVERDETAAQNDDFECELRGPVESISGDAASFSYVVQGITVLTDSVAEGNFQGDDDLSLGRAGFFERLQVGDIVEADSFEGDAFCMPGTLDAREVEFEQDDDNSSSDD
jgi:hypothetical protein